MFLVLADHTLTREAKITKSAERSQHDRTNTIQRDWTGYVVAGQQSAADAALMYGSLSELEGTYFGFSGVAAKK